MCPWQSGCFLGPATANARGRREKQEKLARKISNLKEELKDEINEISVHEHAIATLIPKERRLRAKTQLVDGKRIVPEAIRNDFERFGKRIRYHQRTIGKIEKTREKEFETFAKSQREWLRLQGKETDYTVDVELDQITTYFRASLVHLYAYFIRYFLGGEPIGMVSLIHRVVHLHATIEETKNVRKIILQDNHQDPTMMKSLRCAVGKLNKLIIRGSKGKIMSFSFG
ncbi:MAG: hypothetical protein GY866_19890 [Proteobacteria bacterium]|nr:hypothetical protein [Pseudomonadota bacterium]